MGNTYLQQRFEGSVVGNVTLFLTLSYKSYKIWTSNVKFGNKLASFILPLRRHVTDKWFPPCFYVQII